MPTDDRWNQFVTETKEYRDGAFEAAKRANARAEDAETASEDAQAAARAAKASENAAKVSENAAKVSENAAAASEDNARISAGAAAVSEGNAAASADKAKASETAVAESASKAAADAAKAASAAKKAADESAAAAGSAAQAEAQKTAAAKSASDAQGYMQTASGAATAANVSAENAAGSKAAAGNFASAAEESKQAAGASEVKAAASEQAAKASEQAAENVRDDAQTAQQGAEAARDAAAKSAEAAAKSEANAKQSADTLAESVENITPDDSTIGDKPWSSKHIVDMLCPPLEESGNPVVCYPVAGYPLGVKASWEPVQEGSGTPSPENIRPIKGHGSVTVERCGENLLNPKENAHNTYTPYGLTITYIGDDKVHLKGTYNLEGGGGSFVILDTQQKLLAGRNLKITGFTMEGTKQTYRLYGLRTKDETAIAMQAEFAKGDVIDMTVAIVVSKDTPSTYTPYIGQTNTLTLPETVYGGEVDAVSSEGQETQKLVILNGTESWNSWGINAHNPAITGFYTYDINDYDAINSKGICSHLETPNQDVCGGRNAGIGFATVGSSRYFMFSMLTSSLPDISAGHEVASLKAYLAAQDDAGTPVQIAYKLAEPVPFTATGAQPLSALAGVNTVLTDADSATVTGRADPFKKITDLEDAVASIN